MKCFVCGKDNKPKESVTHEFQHGTVSVCYQCRDAFMYQLNGGNVPIWWLAVEDLHQSGLTDPSGNRISDEEADGFTMKDLVSVAKHTEELLNEQYESLYDQVIRDALPFWRKEKEEELVMNTPERELPLLIGSLKHSENIDLLQSRLKGDQHD